MDLSEEMKAANEWADEAAAKQEARAKKLDRKTESFADDRAAELDRAVANAEAVAKEGKVRGRKQLEKARGHLPHRKVQRPAT